MSNKNPQAIALECSIAGVGAWGPGFGNWQELRALLSGTDEGGGEHPPAVAPKPAVIPANERRRAPLPVKAAVEVSSQALEQSGLQPCEVACVFGSGLGDTEITDYMCRVLAGGDKQLSPTKFHNSVHNAAAGYWTISTGCMKSANSIAGYQQTAGLALLEGVTLCVLEQEPVLVTLFDTAAHEAYRQIFPCRHSFAAAIVLNPAARTDVPPLATLTLQQSTAISQPSWQSSLLTELYRDNPAAQILALLQALDRALRFGGQQTASLPTSASGGIALQLQAER